MKKSSVFLFLFLIFAGPLSANVQTDPDRVTQTILQQVRQLLKNPVVDAAARKESLKKLLESFYDFEGFYEIALQDHWPSWADSQKRDFSSRFRETFLQNLASKFEGVTHNHFVLTKTNSQIASQHAEVTYSTNVKGNKTGFRVFFVKRNGEWKICDVEIDGVLLSRNYRAQFNRIIRNESYSGLLARLESKLSSNGEKP